MGTEPLKVLIKSYYEERVIEIEADIKEVERALALRGKEELPLPILKAVAQWKVSKLEEIENIKEKLKS